MRNYQYDILKDINCEFNGFLKKKIKKNSLTNVKRSDIVVV